MATRPTNPLDPRSSDSSRAPRAPRALNAFHAGPQRSGAPATRSARPDRPRKNFCPTSSVTTETTDNIEGNRGILFYDAACGVCRGMMRRFGNRLARRGYRLVPLQSPHAAALTGRSTAELMEEAHLLTADGRVLRGIDTVLHIAAACPFTRPLTWLARLPGVTPLLRRGYRLFARNRYGISRACGMDAEGGRRLGSLPPLALVAAALVAGRWAPPWVWMWSIALSVFVACKWWTWGALARRDRTGRTLAYFFATPTMDARAFFAGPRSVKPRAAGEWCYAIRNVLAGAAIVWIVARMVAASGDLRVATWLGMIGTILMLHFGVLHLLALAWNAAGFAGESLMDRPTRAATLAEFWGRRWNRGFSTPARELLFAPLIRRGYSAAAASAVVFGVSGVVHDLVISLPARGGYGLPTLYFVLQLAGVLIERTTPLRRLVRRHPRLGRACAIVFAVVFAIVPAPLLLFHEPFVRNVFAPFLHAIGGLP